MFQFTFCLAGLVTASQFSNQNFESRNGVRNGGAFLRWLLPKIRLTAVVFSIERYVGLANRTQWQKGKP